MGNSTAIYAAPLVESADVPPRTDWYEQLRFWYLIVLGGLALLAILSLIVTVIAYLLGYRLGW
jgi:hypothetical protein